MSERPQLRRVAAEFVVIVLGVVAALGVDRWVQGIDDARAERDYLALVLQDVEANAAIFERMLSDWGAASEAVLFLKSALEEDARPSDSGLLVAVARAGTINTIPARDGSFRDMEATGNVRLISDGELRAQIVAYFTQELIVGRPTLEDRMDLRFRTFYRERIATELSGHRDLCPREVLPSDCRLESPSPTDALWADLSGDAAMRGVLNHTLADANNALRLTQFWLDSTTELLERLRGVPEV